MPVVRGSRASRFRESFRDGRREDFSHRANPSPVVLGHDFFEEARQHLEGSRVEAALGDDQVGKRLHGFDKLVVPRPNDFEVLLNDRIEGSSPVRNVAFHPPDEPDVVGGVDVDFQVEKIANPFFPRRSGFLPERPAGQEPSEWFRPAEGSSRNRRWANRSGRPALSAERCSWSRSVSKADGWSKLNAVMFELLTWTALL